MYINIHTHVHIRLYMYICMYIIMYMYMYHVHLHVHIVYINMLLCVRIDCVLLLLGDYKPIEDEEFDFDVPEEHFNIRHVLYVCTCVLICTSCSF